MAAICISICLEIFADGANDTADRAADSFEFSMKPTADGTRNIRTNVGVDPPTVGFMVNSKESAEFSLK